MEYVDVEGLIQPILTIKVNTREAGSVESIVGEEGSLLQQGDTILILSIRICSATLKISVTNGENK